MSQPALFLKSTAVFSSCRTWRYILHRVWAADQPQVMVVGLNPSTATETVNDPTVTRCINYARAWGYGGMVMTNLFAFRATDLRVMKAAPDPVGPENNHWLLETAKNSSLVLCAWGNHGVYENRAQIIPELFRGTGITLHCLGFTKFGAPKHPLYLKADLRPVEFR
jgi:hypothetical protein